MGRSVRGRLRRALKQSIVSTDAEACANCVSRRDFLARVAIVAGTMVAAACGGAEVTGIGGGPLPGGPLTVSLSDYPALATVGQPVELRTASGAGSGVAAVRTGPDSFIALGMACTHQGTKVNIVGQQFLCPNHGSRFTSSGVAVNPPATQPLVSRTVSVDAGAQTLTVS